MKTKISVTKEGFVEVVYHGNQDEASMRELTDTLFDVIKPVKGKVDYLIDLRDAGKSTLGARQMVVGALKKMRISRQAIFGGSKFNKVLLNFMIQAVNQGDKYRYFENRQDALAWLKSFKGRK